MTAFDQARFDRDVERLMGLTVPTLRLVAKRRNMTITDLTRKREIAESIAYQTQYQERLRKDGA